jgi:hypothetical protein
VIVIWIKLWFVRNVVVWMKLWCKIVVFVEYCGLRECGQKIVAHTSVHMVFASILASLNEITLDSPTFYDNTRIIPSMEWSTNGAWLYELSVVVQATIPTRYTAFPQNQEYVEKCKEYRRRHKLKWDIKKKNLNMQKRCRYLCRQTYAYSRKRGSNGRFCNIEKPAYKQNISKKIKSKSRKNIKKKDIVKQMSVEQYQCPSSLR